MTFDLRYYLAVLLRRVHYVALAFAVVTALSVVVAFRLSPVYESTARLLLESPQIPGSLAAPTVDTAALEQLQIVEQRLMTRQSLLEIARKFNALSNIDTLTPDAIVEGMRAATKIDKQAGRDQATLMTITFHAPSGQAAANVVNEYVTRVLADNTASRTGQAQDTLQFFTQEVDRLTTNLSTQSAAILAFQSQNADALPDTLNYRLTQQASLQERLTTVQRDIAGLRDQRARLIEIYRATGGAGPSQSSPEAQQLAQLKIDLARALAIYAPTNPKVTLLQGTIAQLQAKLDAQSSQEAAEATAPAQMTPLDIQTTQLDAQIAQLELQVRDITAQLSRLKDSIDRTAAVAVQLQALQRDYDNTQAQYATASDRLAKASTGERIEALAKGQRIGVLDAATVADQPASPNRLRIVLLGGAAGVALGFGLILLTELLNSAIRRPTDLERHLQIIPIGVIPYVFTPREIRMRRLVIGTVLIFGVVGLPLAVWAVDTYYMPIDLILAKIAKKLNF
jgi:polysaccharide chain length determinant protein (PEP-CTERM system associated)